MKKSKKYEESESEEENDSDYGEDMLEMVEDDDLDFIKKAITSKSYHIFNKVKYSGVSEPRAKKRKLSDEDSDLEKDFEDQTTEDVPMKNLLPIKTKRGIIPQQIVDESSEKIEPEDDEQPEEKEEEFEFIDDKFDLSKPISATQLLTERNRILKEKKIHIGTLSAGVLENPEEKVTNLRTLLKLMDEDTPEVYFTVRKLAVVSLLEVFKDVLPAYEIKKIDNEGVKLKKDTLKLQKYEENLLLYYKKFLQKLERSSLVLVKKKGDTRKLNEEIIKLGELAIQSLCELLVTHPYFNYAQNVAQAVVPFMNNPRSNIREITKNAIKTVFKEDKKEEITLKILRIINNYLKNHAHNVNPDMLETFLVLKLKDVNLDEQKEQDIKQKKLMAQKHKVLQMSKKERKRKKKLQLLEKELLETKAEENRQAKQQNLTEITKIVFGIYFRILKSSTNTKVLGVCLEGLAKFSHCINIDFYLDLLNILDKLLKEDWIGYREQLHCIQTVFSILSGQGEALNVDPTRFYTNLYKDLLTTHASRNHANFLILIKTLNDALIKRRKKITNKRAISFVKRLATLGLQLLHNGTLGSLGLIKNIMQLNRSVDILLDLDTSFGDGKFQAELEDPEYANASSTALYELFLLSKHYHPVVTKFSKNIAFGVPSSGEGSLDPEYGNCPPEQLYSDFDMSEMAFNPAVPVPRKNVPKLKNQRHLFVDNSFRTHCVDVLCYEKATMYRYSCSHLATATNIPIANILSSKERPVCADCGCPGPNLWICLFKNCLQIVCGEKSKDHSTVHNLENPTHCIHMNLLTKRIWCYECKCEVFMEPSSNVSSYDSDQEIEGCTYKSRDSGHGSYSTLRTNTPERLNVFAFEKTVGLNVGMSGDASEGSDGEDSSDYNVDRPIGLVGLQNIGNTCYMNAALQALSNAVPLTRFFLECATTVQILSEGKKPGLSRTYQTLIRDMWKKNGGYVTPSGILYGIRSVHPMFRGYYQHDTQEFLRNFMDQLHEELKQVSPPESASLSDSDTFSLAMDEPAMSSSYDSSEGEYETCDSGVSERSSLSDDTERPASSSKRRLSRSSSPGRRIRTRLQSNSMVIDSQPSTSSSSTTSTNKKQQKYRSIISDIFDGKLLSSVQCLTCDRVSSRVETFQDLSLPIPSRDHLVVLHGRTSGPGSTCSEAVIPVNDGWISWILAWLKSWFYGPVVTLHDCLAAFFSTDELKGDNMYSCEKCNKLRNGIKFSKVLQLPEVLCIHLKRFRHELMFSSKISSAVSFPLKGLDMRPYLHSDCVSKVTMYELFSVICHYGTAGGGHYICYALNGGQWYEFDDQYVTRVPPEKVQSCEAYVLFYRKVTCSADEVRSKAIKLAKTHSSEPYEVAYVSKQWISRFNTCAEPGAIDNSDFLCQHGSINPDREIVFDHLAVALPLPVYEYLHKKFGGCPPVTSINICPACLAFNKRLLFEMETFVQLNREAQNQDLPMTHLISTSWYTTWHKFVQKRTAEPPGPIDNTKINMNQIDLNESAEITEGIWNFFFNIYGGGPELRLRQRSLQRTESESSIPSDGGEVVPPQHQFVIPALKKQEKSEGIDKNVYCAGEPMEVDVVEGEVECNGFPEEGAIKENPGDVSSDNLSNGIYVVNHSKLPNATNIDNDVSDDEVNVEIKNSKRHRRRRKALSSIN